MRKALNNTNQLIARKWLLYACIVVIIATLLGSCAASRDAKIWDTSQEATFVRVASWQQRTAYLVLVTPTNDSVYIQYTWEFERPVFRKGTRYLIQINHSKYRDVNGCRHYSCLITRRKK
jgi:hypothetical protein